jgi:hypothetical protein
MRWPCGRIYTPLPVTDSYTHNNGRNNRSNCKRVFGNRNDGDGHCSVTYDVFSITGGDGNNHFQTSPYKIS